MGDERILLVDDEPHVVSAFERRLKPRLCIETATHPSAALNAVRSRGPYAVVVSDLRMPEMDGIELLSRIRRISPDTVRMMLTGYADVETAIQAVNEGNVFRFLTKPCPSEFLEKALRAGLEQYRLIKAERELLEQTLRGSIKVMTELLGLVKPEAFDRSVRIARMAAAVARAMDLEEAWKIETAAMLSQIGWVTFPDELMDKIVTGAGLTQEEQRLFQRHPFVASNLVAHIPRMGEVAEIISLQEKRFDGSGFPEGPLSGQEIPVGARILKVVLDLDALERTGVSPGEALETLRGRPGWYDPMLLAALESVIRAESRYVVKALPLLQMAPGMILAEDVRSQSGTLLLAKGREVSQPIVERLLAVAQVYGLAEPILVFVPVDRGQQHRASQEDARSRGTCEPYCW